MYCGCFALVFFCTLLCSVSAFPQLVSILTMAQAPQAAAAAAPAAAAAAAAAAPGQAQRPPVAGLARPVVVPPDFVGHSQDDWPTFIARFDAACAVNGYAAADRLQFLPCCLKDSAFTTYQTVLQANPQITYPQLCHELGQRFNPPQQCRLVEAEFRARTKGAQESQQEYANALQRLAARAYPGQQGQLLERLLLNQFIDGQQSPELRLHIRTASPATLDEAVRRAFEVAAILDVEARRTGAPQQAQVFATSAISRSTQNCAHSHVNDVIAATAPSSATSSSATDPLVLTLLTKISDQLATLQVPASAPSQPSPRRVQYPSGGGGIVVHCKEVLLVLLPVLVPIVLMDVFATHAVIQITSATVVLVVVQMLIKDFADQCRETGVDRCCSASTGLLIS